MAKKRILVYARVSTKDKGQVVEAQLEPCRAYIASQVEWKEAAIEEFLEKGHSGAKARRPALDRVMAEVQTGTVAAVVVFKLDRFGRSLQHLIGALEELRRHKTDFVSVTERLDTSTAQGELLFNLLGAFAQFERSLIVERVLNGMAYAREHGTKSQRKLGANGKPIGRPRVIGDREAVRQDAADGLSIRALAAKYRLSSGTVQRMLGRAKWTRKRVEKEATA